ncbi:MAG: hypothetical protein M3Y27_24930, partial [Acidobacteriota bacterium]|nr:hypothetical protein [Acidobacteriota bacterium]
SNPSYESAFNGIVYIHSISDAVGNRRGIRIKNGSRIPTAGLTIARNNAVYVQGDFNTGATGGTVPSNVANSYSDPNNPPNPQTSAYTRAPTSILADAVNVLSNSWNDANSAAALSSRVASNTTINAAFVSGIVPTNVNGDGGYSGGAENFPRFLENWSASQLTYYGSMVELYKSKYSTGEWGAASYSPPLREWFFDNNFKITPPPGSLMIFSYNKGLWSVQ